MPVVVGLAAVVVALVAVLFAFAAASLLRPILAGALAAVPGIGGWIRDRTDALILAAVGYTAAWSHTAAVPLVGLFRALSGQAGAHAGALGEVADATRSALWTLLHVSLPQAAAEVRDYAYAQASYAADLARWAYEAANAYSGGLFGQLGTYVQQQAAYAAAVAGQLFTAQVTYAQQLSAENQAFAQALAAIGIGYTQAAEARAEQYAAAAVGRAEGFTIEVDRALRDFVGIEAGILQGYAEALFGRSIGYTRDSNAVTAANSAAAVGAVAVAVTAIEESACMRQCAQLGALGSLLGGLELAGLMALVAAAVADPPAAALHMVEDLAADALALGRGIAETVGVGV